VKHYRLAVLALLVAPLSCGQTGRVAVRTVDRGAPATSAPRPILTSTSTTSTTAVRQLRPEVPRAHTTAPMMRAASLDAPAGPDPWSCGGDLPPCWVLHRENPNRDLRAYNGGCHAPVGYTGPPPCGARHSTASGKWQDLRSTWNLFGGFVNAADAPWWVQDEFNRGLWDDGAGCSHWSAC
jgi:hypothetical protein